MEGIKNLIKLICCLFLLLLSYPAIGGCLSLIKGPIILDVYSCKIANPKVDFSRDFDTKIIKNLTPGDRKAFFQSYVGYIIKGRVVKSKAVQKGLDIKQTVLNGKKIKVLLKPNKGISCRNILKHRVSLEINERCCNGGVDAPCLLNTTYLALRAKILGSANSRSGDKKRLAAKKDKEYKMAMLAFKEESYIKAIRLFEKVHKERKLDIKGYYFLSLSYKKLDQCSKAIPHLKYIIAQNDKQKVWGDQLNIVRKATYLLARCYAKENEPGKAVLILSSYLISPKQYRKEILDSLRDKDFGWINSSKEYKKYKKDARKALYGN